MHRGTLVVLVAVLLPLYGGPMRVGAAGEKTRPADERSSRPIEVSQADDGKTIKAAPGNSVMIRLPGNPSTGYSWRNAGISGGRTLQTPQAEPAYQRGPNRPGASGVFVFPLKAMQAGKATVKLEYVRPWEKGKVAAKTFSVTIEVSGDRKVKPMELTAADNGKTLKATVGEMIAISLEGNPTTGFSWQIGEVNGKAVQAAGEPQYAPQPNPAGMVGTGGTFVCRFKAVGPGKATVTLHYRRPWEKNIPPAETFTATIEVQTP